MRAERCANCGRADLIVQNLLNFQCLACGAFTNIETRQVVVQGIPNVITSPSGNPVPELSNGRAQTAFRLIPVDATDDEWQVTTAPTTAAVAVMDRSEEDERRGAHDAEGNRRDDTT